MPAAGAAVHQFAGGQRTGRITHAAAAVVICFVVGLLGIAFPEALAQAMQGFTGAARRHLDWLLLGVTVGFLLLAAALALGPWGRLRLGRPGERPEFSTFSWLAMMFAAGMGQGLLFFGVAEPMQHFVSPLADPSEAAASRQALVVTMFHWGFHVWGIYCIAGLVVAYYAFRRRQPYLTGAPLRNAFRGRWVGSVAWSADLLALVAVVFGLGGSVALGSKQLAAGLHATTGAPADSLGGTIVLLWAVIGAAILSATTSLNKGIRWLSNANMVLMSALLLAVLFLGPTGYLAESLVGATAEYLRSLPELSTRSYPFTTDAGWFQSKSLTYFIWMVSWSPFVGIFLARIGRGRTIREFIGGVLVVPTLFSVCSFAVFGSAGFHHVLFGGGSAEAIASEPAVSVFLMLDSLPLSSLLAPAAVLAVFIFIVTSADSGTFVLGMLSSGGSVEPPARRKLAWGIGLGVLSTAFLLGQKVDVILAMAMSGAVPFVLILVLQVVALLRALYEDRQPKAARAPVPAKELVTTRERRAT